jgi:hypothetical protein
LNKKDHKITNAHFSASIYHFFFWCPRLDSNQHTLRRRHLKTVRLPISPLGHPDPPFGELPAGDGKAGAKIALFFSLSTFSRKKFIKKNTAGVLNAGRAVRISGLNET